MADVTTSSAVDTMMQAANAAGIRTAIGTVIGTDVQAFSSDLSAFVTNASWSGSDVTFAGALSVDDNLVVLGTLSVGGIGFTFADAGADAVFGWDDSAGDYRNLSAGDARTALGLSALATTTPGANIATFLATPSSANLAAALTDETGSGLAVFNTAPVLASNVTIGTAGGTTGAILLKGTTSGTVTLTVAAAAGTYSLTLPTTDGDADQFLQTNGSGVTTWATPAGSGTINSGTTNNIPKYTAATTIDDSLLSDDGTTLTYTGTGGLSISTGSGAGTVTLVEGTAPSLTANAFKLYAAADVAAGGLAFVLPAAAGSGVLTVTNSSGVMTIATPAALTVANGGTGIASGTSGGVPYFSGSTTIASSAALAANAIVIGGGAGAAPATTTTGTGVVTALGVNVGSAGAFVTFNGAGGTPSSITLTNGTGLPASGIAAGTLGALVTLGEGAGQIALDPALSADGTYSGIVMTGTSGYTQAFGDVVYLDPTDSRWEACDANAAAGADGDCRGTIGMVVVAGTDGNSCTILLRGKIRADANFPALTINNPIYISETAGDITQTQPTTTDVVIRIIGAALTADEMLFMPDNMWITHT